MCLKFTNHYLSEPNKNNQIPYIMEQFALIRDMYICLPPGIDCLL